jgi:hypothetical protein
MTQSDFAGLTKTGKFAGDSIGSRSTTCQVNTDLSVCSVLVTRKFVISNQHRSEHGIYMLSCIDHSPFLTHEYFRPQQFRAHSHDFPG